MDNEINPKKDFLYVKLGLVISFVAGDLYLNSKAEYEALEMDEGTTIEKLAQLQMLLFGLQILLQLSIASTLFLILCNTFPFQVGLLFPFQSVIFKWSLILQLMYMILSCGIGGMRLNQIFVNGNTDVWKSLLYRIVSTLHKLVAPCYYAASLRSALSLGHEKYYTKDAWVPSPKRQEGQGSDHLP